MGAPNNFRVIDSPDIRHAQDAEKVRQISGRLRLRLRLSVRSSLNLDLDLSLPSLAAALLGARRVSARQGWAGEKSGLFEHPARGSPVVLDVQTIEFPPCHNSFSAAY